MQLLQLPLRAAHTSPSPEAGRSTLALLTVTGAPVGRDTPTRPTPASVGGAVGGGAYVPSGTLAPFGSETGRFPALARRSR